MKTILITGASGFVGSAIIRHIGNHPGWNVIGTSRRSHDYTDIVADLTDKGAVAALSRACSPDVIVHTAAMAKTDICEKNREECHNANVSSTKNLIEAFPESKFIFFSTYAVYNTEEGNCDESCSTNPTNYYIETKIEAENYVRGRAGHIIFRPSVIFGYTPFTRATQNYFMQLLDMVQSKKVMRSPADQYFNPVLVNVVADIVMRSIEENISGTYNIGSTENISKYDFNRMIMERFHFEMRYLRPIESKNLAVSRPDNGTVSSSAIQHILSYRIPPLAEMVHFLYEEMSASTNLRVS
ncbi:MAG: hypothetical protein APR53_03300 [Methanoculleus sp. SDB]|nr:MAG: hypothetical protein APR53_03300 [Methanoculleus sp. SDB]